MSSDRDTDPMPDAPRVTDAGADGASDGDDFGFGAKFWAMNRRRVIEAERTNDSYSLFEGTSWATAEEATDTSDASTSEGSEPQR